MIKEKINERLKFLEDNKDKLTIDGDVHLTDVANLDEPFNTKLEREPNYYQGRPVGLHEVLNEMDIAGIDMCMIWQNPASTLYKKNENFNYQSLLSANRFIYESVKRYPQKFIPGGWIDPNAMSVTQAKKMISVLVTEYGFPIVKMNPAQNEFMIDSPVVLELVEEIYRFGAIPAFHFGADTPFTPVEALGRLVEALNGKTLIAVHMGGGGAGYLEAEETYAKARTLGLNHPNLKYILSAKRDCHIESDLISYEMKGKPFSENLICASDFPYGKMTWNFGGFRCMFDGFKKIGKHPDQRINNKDVVFTNEAIQKYLGGNMAKLAIDAYLSILSKINDKVTSY
ncbi:MAG: hypothetical protein JXA77_04550 [Bacteroidales bacterium]|nr:hypothetical protein [Bacteroidales bacterium]